MRVRKVTTRQAAAYARPLSMAHGQRNVSFAVLGLLIASVETARAREAVTSTVDASRASEKPTKTTTSGLAVSGGLGTQYPIVGVQVAYYLQLSGSLFRAAPYVSTGIPPCTLGTDPGCVSGLVGVMGSWGEQHRLVVDAFYGTVEFLRITLEGESLPWRPAWGAGLAAGYEYMNRSTGCFLRTEIGASYAHSVPILAFDDRFYLALTPIGVGCKLW